MTTTYGLAIDRSLPRPVLLNELAVGLVVEELEVVRLPVGGDREDVLDVCRPIVSQRSSKFAIGGAYRENALFPRIM